jgi:pyruvate dehydrogenase E1 component alpha subunit
MGHMLGKGIDVKYFMAEHTGRTTGCCKGRSSYHAYFAEYGLLGITGFIGNNFPPTVGWGLACKKNGRGQVVMNCFGDGGSNRGTLHEAFLISSNWKLPIINVCENNGLAMFAPVTDCHPTENIADLAKGYGMPASIVDGQDVIACAEVALQAIEHARAGKGPYFIEAKTCRFESHCIGNPDLIGYAPRCLSEEEMSKLDPIRICRDRLIAEGVLTQELIEQIDADAAREVAEAEQFVADSPIANELDMQDVSKLVYAD